MVCLDEQKKPKNKPFIINTYFLLCNELRGAQDIAQSNTAACVDVEVVACHLHFQCYLKYFKLVP